MIIEEQMQPMFDHIDPNLKTISILKRNVIKRDGVVIGNEDHRCAFVPGDIEAVKEYIGMTESPEITYLESIWTPEVIQAYEQTKADALNAQ